MPGSGSFTDLGRRRGRAYEREDGLVKVQTDPVNSGRGTHAASRRVVQRT